MPILTSVLKSNRNFDDLLNRFYASKGNYSIYAGPMQGVACVPKYVIYRAEYIPPTWYRHFFGSGWRVTIKEYVPYRTKKGKWNWNRFWQKSLHYNHADEAKTAAKQYKRPGLHNRSLLMGIIEEYEEVFKERGVTFLDGNKNPTVPELVLADWFEEMGCIEAAELLRLTEELTGKNDLAVHQCLYKTRDRNNLGSD